MWSTLLPHLLSLIFSAQKEKWWFVKLSGSWNTIFFINQHCECCCYFLISHFLISTFPAVEVSEYYFKFIIFCQSLLSFSSTLTGERMEAGLFLFQNKANESKKDFLTLWSCFYFIFPVSVKGLWRLCVLASRTQTPAHCFFHGNQRQSCRLFCLLVLLNSLSLCRVSF